MNSGEQNVVGVRLNEHVACSFCGRYGAFEIGHRFLCPNCYESCGSCCPEFSQDDLQARAEDPEAAGTDGPPGGSKS